jgi:hypothetical protein
VRADPQGLADRTAAEWIPFSASSAAGIDPPLQKGEFRLPVWGQLVRLTYPGLIASYLDTGQELGVDLQALLLYHFTHSDGTPLSGQWISFAELPDGRFYNQASQGYPGNELARAFQSKEADFQHAAESLGGLRLPFGDAAFAFRALPRVALLAVLWRGDEDFPTSFKILFDASAGRHLTTDLCAILGSMLTRRIIKAFSNTS